MDSNEDSTTQIDSKETTELTWNDLGLADWLCEACQDQKWKLPTKIQREAIPQSLQGKDIIGLAETGSGKTAAFALPILQELKDSPQYYKGYFALILAPTRELAFQISEHFESLGASIQVKCVVIVGNMDMMTQALMLTQKPHIIIATPGRLVDHLENTKGFSLNTIKYLVLDEADRILNKDFGVEVDKILKSCPKQRKTMLFSATMTNKVQKLQRASLKNPVKIEVSSRYQTVINLEQFFLFYGSTSGDLDLTGLTLKNAYLVYLLKKMQGKSVMIFRNTCNSTIELAFTLRAIKPKPFRAVYLHGKMSQKKRLEILKKFKEKDRSILISTDIASRGIDIPHVDVVINFDISENSKDYIHRVGRTARAGRSGIAITFVNELDIEILQTIQNMVSQKLLQYPTVLEDVQKLKVLVAEAQIQAKKDLKELNGPKFGKRKGKNADDDYSDDDTELSIGVRKRIKVNSKTNPQK